jgi:hypothetical protein
MASAGPRASSCRLARVRRACLLGAVALSAAGCVGMPQTGQVGTYSNKQAGTEQNPAAQIGFFPTGPERDAIPTTIVSEFLVASASYPADAPIVQEYLAGSAKDWNPGWSVTVLRNIDVTGGEVLRLARHGAEQALVNVSGPVQARFTGAGQIVSASAQGGNTPEQYQFRLVKVDGQWRILNPPPTYRLVVPSDFPQDYQAQDLYFFAAPLQGQDQAPMLVPDSVFVPRGTPPQPLVLSLVTALADGPGSTWLQSAAVSAFPAHTKILSVQPFGAAVTVDLSVPAGSRDTHTLEEISAQLVWTLAGPSASVPTIQSVELELDGHPWSPPRAPCGTGQAPTAFQKLASYECFDPYPSAPASFSYIGGGQPWSRCGTESEAQTEAIGSVVSVFGRTGSASSHQCGGYVDRQSQAQYPRVPPTAALSMVAVSPDGHYVAGVSPAPRQDALYIGLAASGTATSFSASERLKNQPGITAISWDREDDLWAAQAGDVYMLPGSGSSRYQITNEFPPQVTALAVAPDGVRIAVIAQDGSGNELELAAINRNVAGQEGVQRGSPIVQWSIGPGLQLAPNLTDPIALTWYNADTIIVLEAGSAGNTLWSVPVDGEQATQLPVTQSGTISITADNAANYLVAGLANGRLAVSASTAGPWEDLGDLGSDPAYP